ncbi:MAG: DNA cytosine methyltransferase [Arenicella sp.]
MKAIDLFSGCGGLTQGLKKAGFEVVGAVENEPISIKTYKRNHREVNVSEGDIRKIEVSKLREQLKLQRGELDLLAGCPPCQGFSSMKLLNGRKECSNPSNDLIFEFMRFVLEFKPKAIMIENVPRLAKNYRLLSFINELTDLGYSSNKTIVNAVNHGIPQARKRMVLTAILEADVDLSIQNSNVTKTVHDAIGSMHEPGSGSDPLHDYKANHSQKVERIIQNIPKNGGSRSSLPTDLVLNCHKKTNGFKDVYGRMSWDKPSPTITGGCINPSKGRFLHPEQNRAITLREASMLQGFPKNYFFSLERGRYHAAQMIGNAFPPRFATHYALAIKDKLFQLQ